MWSLTPLSAPAVSPYSSARSVSTSSASSTSSTSLGSLGSAWSSSTSPWRRLGRRAGGSCSATRRHLLRDSEREGEWEAGASAWPGPILVRAQWRGDTVEAMLPVAVTGPSDLEDVRVQDVVTFLHTIVSTRCGTAYAGDRGALVLTAGGCVLEGRASLASCLSMCHSSWVVQEATRVVLRVGVVVGPKPLAA
jgi:hypothetical protein